MKNENKIDNMFSEAKIQKPLLDETDAKMLIENHSKPNNKISLINKRGVLIMTVLTSITAVLLFTLFSFGVFNQANDSHNIYKKSYLIKSQEPTSTVAKQEIEHTKKSTSNLAVAKTMNAANNALSNESNKKQTDETADENESNAKDSGHIFRYFVDKRKNSNKQIHPRVERVNLSGINYIRLKKDELKKLGLEIIRDSIKKPGLKIKQFFGHSMMTSYNYKDYSIHEIYNPIIDNDLKKKTFHPILLTDANGIKQMYQDNLFIPNNSRQTIFLNAERDTIPLSLLDEIYLHTHIYSVKKREYNSKYFLEISRPIVLTKNDSLYIEKIFDQQGVDKKERDNFYKGKNNIDYKSLGMINLNKIIPIKVDIGIDDNDKENDFTLFLWYEPTEEFINLLPERYRTNLKMEVELAKDVNNICKNSAIVGKKAFFDVWHACSGSIENMLLYPNPSANKKFNVKFYLSESRMLSISIHNLQGETIMNLEQSISLNAGDYSREYSVPDIVAGMYIVVIQTARGEQTVQRIIFK